MKKIIKYVMADILRNKIILAYTVLLLVISLSVLTIENNAGKGLLSLLHVILIIVPLVAIVFSTIYAYNSAEFIELLLSQPLPRKKIWLSLFTGLAGSLTIAFFIGAGIPILLFAPTATGVIMTAIGMLLSVIFVSIALMAVVHTRDKAKGIGLAILLWLYFSLIFDSLVLFMLFQFQEYPLEKAMVLVSALNPIDLGRILILLQMDISAMMGYTGAVFKDIFGTSTGFAIALVILLLWAVVPTALSLRKFNRKDM